MSIIQSIILGIIQGLTEFLPVSSSAHLNLFPWVFGWKELPDSFDVALHLGTLLAILIYFYKDWINLIVGGFNQLKGKKSSDGKIFWRLVVVTIPAGVLGIVLEKASEKLTPTLNAEMIAIAIALIVMGILLYVADKKCESSVSLEKMNFRSSFLIGLSQALAAAFPGVSRSGITMTIARYLKVDRESAAKYSFLLSGPMVAAAVLVSIKDFTFDASFITGVLASFISGLLVIKFLMNYLKKGSFKVFAIYRVILGIIIIGIVLFR